MLTRLFTPKWYEVVIALSSTPPHQAYKERLFRRVDLAQTQVRATLRLLIEHGFVVVEPRGHVKLLRLTAEGEVLAMQALALRSSLRRAGCER